MGRTPKSKKDPRTVHFTMCFLSPTGADIPPDRVDYKTYFETAKQAIGGGYVEMVTLDEVVLFCDEDGHARDLPINREATKRWGEFLLGPLLGTVAYIKANDMQIVKDAERLDL
jgi:hypothetical protein